MYLCSPRLKYRDGTETWTKPLTRLGKGHNQVFISMYLRAPYTPIKLYLGPHIRILPVLYVCVYVCIGVCVCMYVCM